MRATFRVVACLLVLIVGVAVESGAQGFQGGIRDVPTWENYLRMVFGVGEETRLSEVQEKAARISNYLNKEHADRGSKIDKWIYYVGTIRLPSGETAYIKASESEN